MKITVSKNLKLFKDAFTMFANSGRETNMVFDGEGLTMITTSANSAASKAHFEKTFFDEYVLEKEKEEFAVVLMEINAVIKKIGFNTLTMEGDESTLTISGNDTKFVTPLLYEADTIPSLPVIEYTNDIETTFGQLSEALGKMSLIKTDSIKLFLEGGKLRMKSAAQIRKVETDVCDAEGEDVKIFLSKQLFDSVLIGGNDKINLFIDNDKPVKTILNKGGLILETIIAPRINEDY